jgi:Tfp pilus assembly protein PilF/predicted nucleic-acid-binding protein
MLKKTCASVSMVATARSTELDKLYEYSSSSFWNNFEKIELEEFERIQTEQLLEVLCGQLNMTMDADAKDIIAAGNDRTPKNPVIFFNWLKNNKIEHISTEIANEFKLSVSNSWNAIYNKLSEIEKKVFQALNVLRYASVIPHKVFVVDLITKQESAFKPRRKGIEKAIETLIEKHLIDEQEKIIRCDDAYLEGKGDFDTNIKTLVDILLKRSKSKEIKDSVIFSLAGLSDVLTEKEEFVENNVKILRKIIELNPELPEAHYNLGVLLGNRGRKEDAEAEYREAIRINPDYVDAHINLGNLLNDMGRKEDAEVEYREALRINSDSADAHYNLGVLLKDMGRKEDAEAEYREALRINPDYVEAHNNLGVLLGNMGRKEDAEVEYREAIRIKPDDADAHHILGNLLTEMGRIEDAEAEYREAIRIKPDYAEAHFILALLLVYRGKVDAEVEFREALRIKSDDAEAHYNLGILFKDMRRKEDARKEDAKKELEIAKRLFDEQGREADVKQAEGVLNILK